jgi:hypothetical protein
MGTTMSVLSERWFKFTNTGRLRHCLTAILIGAATGFCTNAVAAATPASVVDASNSLAMTVVNKRPAPKFHGSTVISPPGLWLTYAAVYVSSESELPPLATAMGYSEKPTHSRILSDAAELKASAGGSAISMRLWTHQAADLNGTARSELARLGVSIVTHPMDRPMGSKLDSLLSQLSNGAFHAFGPELSGMSTGLFFTTLQHRLVFPSHVREPSVVSPSIITTIQGGVASLPGKPIAYYSDATGVTGIRLDAPSGRLFLFTGGADDIQGMLDGLSAPKWAELKSRFMPRPGRIVDSFSFQSDYDFLYLAGYRNFSLWGGRAGGAVQRGAVTFDSDKLRLVAATGYEARGCCEDDVINPLTESQFQWSSLAPLVFIDEAPSGLIVFIGYRL